VVSDWGEASKLFRRWKFAGRRLRRRLVPPPASRPKLRGSVVPLKPETTKRRNLPREQARA